MKWYFDTSVLGAALIKEHPSHGSAVELVDQVLAGEHAGFASVHSLTEVYSVLTRSPAPLRLSPQSAWSVIEPLMVGRFDLIPLGREEYADVVRRCAREGWIGGRVHDAIHVQCALKVNCDRIFTLNPRDFRALSPPEDVHKVHVP